MDIYKNVIPKSSRSIILLTRFVIEDIMILETNIGGYLEWFKDIYGQRWYSKPVTKFFKSFHENVTVKYLKPAKNISGYKSSEVKTTF